MENTFGGNNAADSGMPGKPDGTLNKASSTAHAAVNSIATAAEEAARKVKPAIDGVSTMAHQAVDKVASAAAPAADWLAEQGESLTVAQKKLITNTTSYISANPVTSVGIALVAGLLLSRILR